jgi:hypothetical protein
MRYKTIVTRPRPSGYLNIRIVGLLTKDGRTLFRLEFGNPAFVVAGLKPRLDDTGEVS